MAKLENKLNMTVKPLDSGVSNEDIGKAHATLNNLVNTPTSSALAGKMPEIHVVGNSFPKVGYKDYHIDPVQNRVIIWHPTGDKVPIEKKIHDSLSRLALSSIISKVAPPPTNPGGTFGATVGPAVNTNVNKPISGDQFAKRKNQSEAIKAKRREIIHNELKTISKNMWDNKAHLPPAIKRRLIKNPKDGVSPQTLSLLHKIVGKRMNERGGDSRLILSKLGREASTPEMKKVYESFGNILNKLFDNNWISKI